MRLIDADVLKKNFCATECARSQCKDCSIDYYIEHLASPVDAVEVVRCKDCKHYYADPWGYGNCVFEGGVSRRTKDSDFCSWGERKENEIDRC